MAESSFELVFVSPNIAKMLLKDLYDEQRPYHDTYAQRYAADMKAGRWNPDNPQPIIISDTGKVIDGQHRLHAVIISGCTVPMYLARGASENTYKVVDSGTSRSVPDRLHGLPSAQQVSALAKRIISLDGGATLRTALSGSTNFKVTQQQQLRLIERNSDYLVGTVRAGGRCRAAAGKIGPMSAYTTVLHMAEQIYGSGTADVICDHMGLPTKTALAFQRYMMRLYTGSQQAKPYAVASALVNFADAVLDGRECVGYNKRDIYVKKWEQAYAKGPHLC